MRSVPPANVDACAVIADIRLPTRDHATLYVPQQVAAPRQRRLPAVLPSPEPRAAFTNRATPAHATSEPATASAPGLSQPRTATRSSATSGEIEFRIAAEKLVVEASPWE